MSRPSHVFVVGSARSGTTLMRRILNSSDEVAICGETHFLGSLIQRGYQHEFATVGDIATDAGAEKVVDYIFRDMEPEVFWRWVRESVDRDQFLSSLLESDRSERALFDLVMAFYAKGKPIQGEKTPCHVYHVSTLLKWYPKAKIIHTFRDPRAIFVSKKIKIANHSWDTRAFRLIRNSELRMSIYLSLNVLIYWLKIVQMHHRYEQIYPQSYHMIRYEDLIMDPSTWLAKICDFLEIDFSETMLQQRVVDSSFASGTEHANGFDASAIDRWRKHLHPLINRWFVAWCKEPFQEFGYEP